MAAFALTVYLPGSSGAATQDWAIECRGVLDSVMVNPRTETTIPGTQIHFEWYMDSDGRWVSHQKHANGQPYTKEVAYNGDTIFGITYSETTLRRDADGDIERVPSQGDVAVIGKEIQELPSANFTYFLWFVFLGGELLELGDEPIPLVPLSGKGAQGSMLSFGFVAKGTEHDHLVSTAEWRVDPERMSYGVLASEPGVPIPQREASEVRKSLNKFKGRGEQEYLMSRYRLEESKSVGPIRVPVKATNEKFGFTDEMEGPFVSGRTTITVTNYSEVEPRSSILPDMGRKVWVEDVRFKVKTGKRYRNMVKYPISNGEWPVTTNDARLKEVLADAPPLRRMPAAATVSWYRPGPAVVIIAILLFPLVIVAVRRVMRRKT